MSEMADRPLSPRKNHTTKIVVGIAFIFAIIAGWYFLARPHITQAIAERRVKEIVDNFNASAQAQGSRIIMSYQAVTVEREKGRDIVVVANPTVTMGDENTFSTPRLVIVPKNIDFGSMSLQLRDTLHTQVRGSGITELEHAQPFALDFSTSGNGANAMITYDARLPSEIMVKQYSGVPSTDTLTATTRIMISEPSSIKGKLDQSGKYRQSEMDIGTIKAIDMGTSSVLVDTQSLNLKLEQTMPNEHQVVSQYKVALKELNLGDVTKDYGAISFFLDARMQGDIPAAPVEGQPITGATMAISLNQFEVSSKMASIAATAHVNSVTSETVPIGEANVVVKGLPAILQEMTTRGKLTDGQRITINEVIKKITGGKELAQADPLAIIVKREAGQGLMIGQATFDDLLALYISHSIGQGQLPAIQQVPTDMPAATPIPEGAIPTPPTE